MILDYNKLNVPLMPVEMEITHKAVARISLRSIESLGFRELGLRGQGILILPEGPFLYTKYSDIYFSDCYGQRTYDREIEHSAWYISHV